MPVVKHLYVLIHGSTYCTCGILTVTLPIGEYARVLDSYMGGCMGQWGYTGICIRALQQIRVLGGVGKDYYKATCYLYTKLSVVE